MTTAHALDEREHATAIKAAIKAQLGAWEVYEYGEVPGADGNPGTLPEIYVLVQVGRRYLEPTHGSRRALRTGWRASIRAVGRNAAECRWASLRVSRALDGAHLDIGGLRSGLVEFESATDPEPSGIRCEALSRWTYTA